MWLGSRQLCRLCRSSQRLFADTFFLLFHAIGPTSGTVTGEISAQRSNSAQISSCFCCWARIVELPADRVRKER